MNPLDTAPATAQSLRLKEPVNLGPMPKALRMLLALQRVKKPGEIYHGTASPKAVARRRRRSELARASRKANR